MTPVALTIAGSDPSGGAGIQADLKTFQTHGVYGQAVIALLTVQSTRKVERVEAVSDELLRAQIETVCDDVPPHAIKTGALPGPSAIRIVAEVLSKRVAVPLVIDPIARASSGLSFAREDVVAAYREHLLPIATLVTPNVDETMLLTGIAVSDVASAERAGRMLCGFGASAALIKGGHLEGDPVDVLVQPGREPCVFSAPRVVTPHTHGTGCTLSAAITARIALGFELEQAVRLAKGWLGEALREAHEFGNGRGALNTQIKPP